MRPANIVTSVADILAGIAISGYLSNQSFHLQMLQPILLLCFHYDQVTGRYTLAVMRVLQLGAAITVLVVGGTIMLALRRERRPR